MQNDFKKRLEIAKSRIQNEKKISSTSFNFNKIQGDTGVREIEIDKLIAAPTEWNFYRPLSDDKMTELIESIVSKGLLTPIVVWEQPDDKYMILAGHNRVRAYQILFSIYKDTNFSKIKGFIKKKDEIDEVQAREIIIDTNWVQRQLTDIEKSMSINLKYGILMNNKTGYDGTGRVRDIIAKEYNISGRQVDNYRRLNKLIPPLKEMIHNNQLKATYALKIVSYSDEMQQFIYENFKDKFIRKYMKNLKPNMTKEQIQKNFSNKEEDTIELKFKVPIHLKDLIEQTIKEIIEENK